MVIALIAALAVANVDDTTMLRYRSEDGAVALRVDTRDVEHTLSYVLNAPDQDGEADIYDGVAKIVEGDGEAFGPDDDTRLGAEYIDEDACRVAITLDEEREWVRLQTECTSLAPHLPGRDGLLLRRVPD